MVINVRHSGKNAQVPVFKKKKIIIIIIIKNNYFFFLVSAYLVALELHFAVLL